MMRMRSEAAESPDSAKMLHSSPRRIKESEALKEAEK